MQINKSTIFIFQDFRKTYKQTFGLQVMKYTVQINYIFSLSKAALISPLTLFATSQLNTPVKLLAPIQIEITPKGFVVDFSTKSLWNYPKMPWFKSNQNLVCHCFMIFKKNVQKCYKTNSFLKNVFFYKFVKNPKDQLVEKSKLLKKKHKMSYKTFSNFHTPKPGCIDNYMDFINWRQI